MKWTKKQEQCLKELVEKGLSDTQLATQLSTTVDSVNKKRHRLGLPTAVTVKIPKILFFDIETAPLEVFTFGLWEQNIGINQIKNDWFMFSWSGKWLGDKKVYSDRLTGRESLTKNDKRITISLWKMIDEADIIIAHNGDRFDIKKMNTRFLKYGLPIPRPYKSIDTLKVAKQNFSISSNKLDYLCEFLGLPRKIDTGGFELWRDCYNGNERALKLMDTYCQNDTVILEKVYLKLRPYIKNHPNIGMYIGDKNACSNCGHNDLVEIGISYTNSNRYKVYKCKHCGTLNKDRKAIK